MLRYVLTCTLLLLLHAHGWAQPRNPCQPDSSYYSFISDSLGKSIDYSKTIYAYNGNKQVILGTRYTNSKVFTLDSVLWGLMEKRTSTYNQDGLLSEFLDQYWNETTLAWEDYYKVFYTYSSSQKLTSEITQIQDAGQLVNDSRHLISYNTEGGESLREYYYWDMVSGTWIQNLKTNIYYNGKGQLTSERMLSWNEVDSTWDNYNLDSFNYQANGLESEHIRFIGILNFWSKSSRDTNTYNNAGMITEKLSQMWANSEWMNSTKEIYTYNRKGCLTRIDYYNGWQNNKWLSHSRETFFYTGKVFDAFTFYPNPASSILYLYAPAETPYSIYDMNGKRVLEGIAGAGENTIDIQHLASGIYVVRTRDTATKLVVL